MAVNMLRISPTESTPYTGTFEDIPDSMKETVQTALNNKLIVNTSLLEPEKPITRLEAYTLLMRGICLKPLAEESQNWTQAVHNTIYKVGITDKPLSRFRPSGVVTKKEVFHIASQLIDIADLTGGCRPQLCEMPKK